MESAYYDSLLNATKQEQAIYSGGKIKIPKGCMILELLTYPKSATLYVNPEDITPMLQQDTSKELTPREKIILLVIISLIPKARKEIWYYNGVSEDEFNSLVNKGFITTAYALTLKGKNAVNSYRRQLEDKINDLKYKQKIIKEEDIIKELNIRYYTYGRYLEHFYATKIGLLDNI